MLNLIFTLLGLAMAGGLCFGIELSHWWLLLLIPAGYVCSVILYFAILFVVSCFFPKKEPENSSPTARYIIHISMRWLMSVMRIRIQTTGAELLPQEPCIIVSNHRSDFDPLTVLSVLKKRNLIYISKEGNFKIPIVGAFIRRAGFFAIDRENGMRAMRTLKRAADRLQKEQVDVGIYPEGTRSKNGELLDFKTGAFYLAKKADAPVVVMVTTGTERIAGSFPFRRTKVALRFLALIDREEVRASSMEELAEKTRRIVEEALSADPS